MRGIFAATVVVLAVAGCTKTERGIPPSTEEIAAADQAKCATSGYPVGHPEHAGCRMMLDRQRAEAAIAIRTGVIANPGAGRADAAPLGAPPPPPPLPAAPPGAVQ